MFILMQHCRYNVFLYILSSILRRFFHNSFQKVCDIINTHVNGTASRLRKLYCHYYIRVRDKMKMYLQMVWIQIKSMSQNHLHFKIYDALCMWS